MFNNTIQTTTGTLRGPSVHLNGTGGKQLIEQYQFAADGIRDAISALRDTSPHGRDYYVQGPEAIGEAITQHRARIEKLSAIEAELELLLASVYLQTKGK